MEQIVGEKLNELGKKLEEKVDDELSKFENMKLDDLQSIREQIQKKRKARMDQEKMWRELGHGTYDELADELAFFNEGKKSENFVCHFYRESTERCKIVDKHLKILAASHIETRFRKIDAEKSPFLTGRLQIRVIPTILVLKKNVVMDRIVGFGDLGNKDDFKTEMLEWRLAFKDVIEYEGDKYNPPEEEEKKKGKKGKGPTILRGGRTIRQGFNADEEEEDSE